jgi:hypothetical protein
MSTSSAARPNSSMPMLWLLGSSQASSVISWPLERIHVTSLVWVPGPRSR